MFAALKDSFALFCFSHLNLFFHKAPLIFGSIFLSGQFQFIRKVTVEVSRRMFNLKENHQSTESANTITKNQLCKDSCPGMSTFDNQTVGHGKTGKHMVYQHCRSSSVAGHILHHMKCFITCRFILNCGLSC